MASTGAIPHTPFNTMLNILKIPWGFESAVPPGPVRGEFTGIAQHWKGRVRVGVKGVNENGKSLGGLSSRSCGLTNNFRSELLPPLRTRNMMLVWWRLGLKNSYQRPQITEKEMAYSQGPCWGRVSPSLSGSLCWSFLSPSLVKLTIERLTYMTSAIHFMGPWKLYFTGINEQVTCQTPTKILQDQFWF